MFYKLDGKLILFPKCLLEMLWNILIICIKSSAAVESELSNTVLVHETISERLGLNNLQNADLYE